MHIIAITIAISVFIVAVVGLLAIRNHLRLKERAMECAKEAQAFHERLQRLTEPSHFFTDEELLQLKRDYAPLIDKVYELYDSLLISSAFLDGLGLKDLLHERKFLNHIQSQHNSLHKQQ